MDEVANTSSGGDVVEREVEIVNAQGLHARPAAQFVRIASKYQDTEVSVIKDSMTVNGKSIIGIMMLAAGKGSKLQLKAEGKSAKQVLQDLEELIQSHFGEGEEQK